MPDPAYSASVKAVTEAFADQPEKAAALQAALGALIDRIRELEDDNARMRKKMADNAALPLHSPGGPRLRG